MFDGLILLIERPVLTLITAVVVVGVFLTHGCVYEEKPPVAVQEIQYPSPSEVQPERDRRIVRFAKWLWSKE